MNAPDQQPERLPLMADPEAAAMLRDPELYRQAEAQAAACDSRPFFNAALGIPWPASPPNVTAPCSLPFYLHLDVLDRLDRELATRRALWQADHRMHDALKRYLEALDARLRFAIMAKEPGRSSIIQPGEINRHARCFVYPEGGRLWTWRGEPILEEPPMFNYRAFETWPRADYGDWRWCPIICSEQPLRPKKSADAVQAQP